MHVVAAFEYSTSLEMALQKLEQKGIGKENIVAVPLDRRIEESKLFDTIHRSDGKSLLDVACIWGVICMLLGTIYGFVLTWGPILWGLIGLVFGLLFGFCIDYLHMKRVKKRSKIYNEKATEVFVTVKCADAKQLQLVEEIFWEHFALGVGKVRP
ncbi:hypothetical protein ACFQI7_26135 [Paenibacillus allorhizosphaerae]|uniref:Magnesium transporter n=1 Tax=Paenibacillus allorhizosphaerae TaxID=2849866 RepID=A0ABN7TQ90_9BACL|nr:hypothetical protein [Paenibacillus allorhizosphaerae]CAG7645787.1 hypothetical protein PAECIP111802_03604 [Paenibacillus allorhizosphaerae]